MIINDSYGVIERLPEVAAKVLKGAYAWGRRKTEMNADPVAKQFQKIWRIGCLRQRAAENRMTEKNKAEAIRVGI